jgi:hypothetical protein
MKRTQFVILILLLVVLGAAAFFFLQRSTTSWQSNTGRQTEKIVNLPINQVAQVVIQQPETEINLKKKGDSWVVPARHDYPANFEMISTLIRQVWELKPVQELKVGQSQLGRLSLLEPSQGANGGTLVDFKDEGGKRLAALLVGKKYLRESAQPSAQARSYPAGRYVMPEDGSHRVTLVSEVFSQLDGKPERWLDRDFIKIEKPTSIAISGPTPTMSWKLEREPSAKDWKLSDLQGDEHLDPTKANQVASSISAFTTFIDITDAKPEATGLDKPVVVTVITEDGFTYVLNFGKKMEDNYPLTVSVSANLPTARTPGKDEKPEDKEKLDKEFQTKRETLEKKLAKEKKVEGWTYLLPKYGVEQVEKNRADLFAPKSTPSPTPSASPASPMLSAKPSPLPKLSAPPKPSPSPKPKP